MTKQEMTLHNESLAIQKIRVAYLSDGLVSAMALCQEFMGVSTKEAYNRVKMLCSDLEPKEG